jgi:opacity protein-like surface antigen
MYTRHRLAMLVLLIVPMGVIAPALAQDQRSNEDESDFRPRFEFTPFMGYRMGGKFDYDGLSATQTLNVRDDSSWGFDIGLYRDGASFYEALYSQQNGELETRGSNLGTFGLRTEYAHLGGTLLFPDENWFIPYLSMTAGVTKFDPRDNQYASESDFSMSLGGGVRFPFNEHLAVAFGVRGYLTFVDASSQIFCVSNGGAVCRFHISGNSFFQGEAQLGFVATF